jgi:predicted transcriptional regulator
MAIRRHNPRLAKSMRCYTIVEAADLYGVHRQTVRNWLADGLAALDGLRPVLIHGSELNRFHRSRRMERKQRCGPGELFCLACRAPRRPALGMVEFTPTKVNVGTLSAICPTCECVMTQKVNPIRLALFQSSPAPLIEPRPAPLEKSP